MQFDALRLSRAAGVPTVIWGASVGPFSPNPEYEKYAIDELKRTTLITVRESLTRDYLTERGVEENVRLVADPAFALEPIRPDLPRQIEAILEQGSLGLNLSPLIGRYGPSPENWRALATDCLRELDRTIDMPILLIPHVMIPPTNDDHLFLTALEQNLGARRNPIHVLRSHYTAQQLKWVISRLCAFAGARTHSTIAALSSCVPTASLGYSTKARGINQDIFGHTRWLLRVHDITPDAFASCVRDLLIARDSVKAELERRMPSYSGRSSQGATDLKEVLGGFSRGYSEGKPPGEAASGATVSSAGTR